MGELINNPFCSEKISMDEVVAFYEKMKPYSSKVKGLFKLIHMAGVALGDPLLHTNVDSFNRKQKHKTKKNPLKNYLTYILLNHVTIVFGGFISIR